jgi:hypothetical protein
MVKDAVTFLPQAKCCFGAMQHLSIVATKQTAKVATILQAEKPPSATSLETTEISHPQTSETMMKNTPSATRTLT